MNLEQFRALDEFSFDIDLDKLNPIELRKLSTSLGIDLIDAVGEDFTDGDLRAALAEIGNDEILRDALLDHCSVTMNHPCFTLRGASKAAPFPSFAKPAPAPAPKTPAPKVTKAAPKVKFLAPEQEQKPAPAHENIPSFKEAASMTKTAAAKTLPVQAPAQESRAAALLAAMNEALSPAIDRAEILAMIQEQMTAALAGAELPVKTLIVNPTSTVDMGSDHLHPAFEDILALAAARLNVYLVGGAGAGKSHTAEMVAKALGLPFAAISLSAGISASQLTGWLMPNGFIASDFVTIYENGGVMLLDELDAADANTLTTINGALANGGFFLPAREGKTYCKRHPDFICIAAGNTYGSGADLQYSAREQLDAATLDRFTTIFFDYDEKLEHKAGDKEVVNFIHAIRRGIAALKLRRIASTRKILDFSKMRRAGWSMEKIEAAFFTGWTADEKAKLANFTN